jgi:hypothetical protein
VGDGGPFSRKRGVGSVDDVESLGVVFEAREDSAMVWAFTERSLIEMSFPLVTFVVGGLMVLLLHTMLTLPWSQLRFWGDKKDTTRTDREQPCGCSGWTGRLVEEKRQDLFQHPVVQELLWVLEVTHRLAPQRIEPLIQEFLSNALQSGKLFHLDKQEELPGGNKPRES